MGLDLSGNGSSETMYDEGDGNLAVIVGSVTSTEADDQSSLRCVTVLTDVMSDHIGRRDASRGGAGSRTSAYTGHLDWL